MRRLRVAAALLSLAVVLFNCAAPAFALNPADLPGLDPRFAALLRSRTCGGPATDPQAAAAQLAFATAPPERSAVPSGWHGAQFAGVPVTVVAQASPAPSPSGAPAQSPSPSGSASPSSAPSAPATSTPTPTPIPIPPIPPAGPQEIVAPTPRVSPSPTQYPLPTPSPTANPNTPVFLVRPSGTPSPLVPKGQTPAPSPSGTASPEPSSSEGASPSPTPIPFPTPTLGPYQVVTIADRLEGSTDRTKPSDLFGNVHVFYTEGQIVGDRAHYDGDHTLLVRGHTYLINRAQDSILYADEISFDLNTRKATLLNGSGESIEGVATGKLRYTAQQLTAQNTGVSHGDHASFTTCENPHAGYHVEARSIDVYPGSKLVAHKAVVYLGPTAILYLPLLVIPLVEAVDGRRTTSFIPVIGYDQIEGFYIKARIGFGTSDTYYGYYRLEYFTKRGLGIGYVAYIGAKDAHRYTTIDSYTISDRIADARETNVNIQDTETFSRRLRGQFGISYQGDFGPNLTLPASETFTGSIIHVGNASTENLTFQRALQGSLSDNLNVGFIDQITLSKTLQQQINLTYTRFNSPLSSTDTFHIDTNTHWFTRFADYNLTYDKTNYSSNAFGYDKIPELQIMPHLATGPNSRFLPQFQFAIGDYSERQNNFNTTRIQGQLNESFYAKVLGGSDFQANYNLTQDYYGTGDEKAFDTQNASLSTPLGNHFINALTYNEQHPSGPIDVPFQLFDRLSPASHSAQEVIRFYNKDIYSFSLSDGTNFNRMAQPVTYQLNVRPSPRSYLVIGGFFTPGGGQGFSTTNVQAITELGRDTQLQLSTNVDWKNHNRLEDKNVYLQRIIDQCYSLELSYNQDLKQVNFNVVILAFPGQPTGFGLTNTGPSPIVPGTLGF